jgi:aryl-alcohol dehydrogenase-like predicted oxidoreductase
MVSGGEFDADVARTQRMAALAEEVELESPMELSLRLALAQPNIATVLLGSSDLAQLEQSLSWAARGPLEQSRVDRVLELYR